MRPKKWHISAVTRTHTQIGGGHITCSNVHAQVHAGTSTTTFYIDGVGVQAVHQHIIGVQVAVQDATGVQRCHAAGHLPQDGGGEQWGNDGGLCLTIKSVYTAADIVMHTECLLLH